MRPIIFMRFRRPLTLAVGAITLAAEFALGTASVASAAPAQVTCTDGSRPSAQDIAKAEPRINEVNTTDSNSSDGTVHLATIKLRYSPTYHCAWALISGHPGDPTWIDRWQVPEVTWRGPLGKRDIQSGNSTTYTAAYNVPGYSIRACGNGYEANGHPAPVVCTQWMSEETLQAQSAAGSGQTPVPPAPSAPTNPSHPASDEGIVGNMFADSSAVDCATGTKSLAVVPGYNNSPNTSTPVHLCEIPNLPTTPQAEESNPHSGYYIDGADNHAVVNARISGVVFKMVETAEANGISLVAESSFRTMPHQQDLYSCYRAGTAGCNLAAPGGKSNHQMGLAIDFQYPHARNTCTGGAAQHDPRWMWLKAHAKDFGFRQIASENWHWDTTNIGMCTAG